MATYSITITEPQIRPTILDNIKMAAQNEYGHEFCRTMQAIRKNTYTIIDMM